MGLKEKQREYVCRIARKHGGKKGVSREDAMSHMDNGKMCDGAINRSDTDPL